MSDMFGMRLDDREFNRMLTELAGSSRRSAYDVITDQAQRLLRKLAWFTRRATTPKKSTPKKSARKKSTPKKSARKKSARKKAGRARAGWWPAWRALAMSGTPYVRNAKLSAANEGGFRDKRKGMGELYVEMTNKVPYIGELERQDDILAEAFAARKDYMERALERNFAREMRRMSA